MNTLPNSCSMVFVEVLQATFVQLLISVVLLNCYAKLLYENFVLIQVMYFSPAVQDSLGIMVSQLVWMMSNQEKV